MEKYEFFDHTADVKYHAFGKTLEEAFVNAAKAMMSIIVDEGVVASKKNKSITVKGADLKAVLYNFLEEIIVLLDAEFFLVGKIDGLQIHRMGKEYVLSALLVGDILEDQYETHEHVKAVTYNEMEIVEKDGLFTVKVVLDL